MKITHPLLAILVASISLSAGCFGAVNDEGCGDGELQAGETCDGDCPTECDDANPCTVDGLEGSAETCSALCRHDAITVCDTAASDACCPSGCNEASDLDCSDACGNGVVDPGETCDGNCPASCDDQDVCTTDTLTGTVSSCSAACEFAPITACQNGDGCCPNACDSTSDDDCSDACGNGTLDPGETCDGDCPANCEDGQVCTTDTLTGSAGNCTAACLHNTIATCVSGDGCCPGGCNAGVDSDCGPSCGNGYVDVNETCDGDCPASCDDGQACTADSSIGSAGSCDLECVNQPRTSCVSGDGCCPGGACNAGNDSDCGPSCGNGYVDTNETCDGDCPATCNDGQVCTTDSSSGSAGSCDLVCSNVPITACVGGDGCCPGACSSANDSDCSATCVGIGAVRAAATGVANATVSLQLCPALVTYVSDQGYALQVGTTGPAISVYEGFGWVPDVQVGDEIRMHVTQVSDYHGLQEITLHDPVQLLSSGNAVNTLRQNLSAGIVPSEGLESELVRVDGITVTAISGLDLTVSYGTATGVVFRADSTTTLGFCVGATFDFRGLATEYDVHRLQSFADTDISAFDASSCQSLGRAPLPGDLVINELLADPSPTLGDANCDGLISSGEDEFVEIVNVSGVDLDLGGVSLWDGTAQRHTFLSVGLPAGGVMVVFGGGTPSCLWPANVQVQTAGSLGLNNAGDTVSLLDPLSVVLDSVTYPLPAGDADTSITRYPDLTGTFVQHATTPAGLPHSPGRRVDGAAF
ncbi:MAG: lamin tail domain-containing protein [Deltaproteobacteria bacterium]|nr:lamin tail domain-containing protein [Deltaproteobacteria bacterium]